MTQVSEVKHKHM